MTLVEWIMPAASNLVGPAALSSCDTEMTEGSDLDQTGSPVAKSLCHLLRGIATEPARAPTPPQAVRRLRPFADHTRLELQRTLASSGAIREYTRGQAHLLHGAVAALCHVARFCVDDSPRSIVPPFAAAAVNPHSRRPSDLAVLAILFVVSEDLATRQRAYRMVTFVLTGLSDLGFAVHCVPCAPSSAASLADTLPGAPLTTRNVRYLWGRFSLYDDLCRSLPNPASELEIEPNLQTGIQR